MSRFIRKLLDQGLSYQDENFPLLLMYRDISQNERMKECFADPLENISRYNSEEKA